ncbi:MAG: molybdopterin-synthase adenylyltransferase MoeB [Thiomargarita sp.]|nr:molybdopterin-synthase adenylyltransferase MoeB [Thiomargarita sp.]
MKQHLINNEQLLHYSRQILLPQIGIANQERLLNAKILIMGLGGLGSATAMYLTAAGIGHLSLCDFDKVDLSNLQRQIIHNTNDINKLKVESASDSLLALNPSVEICLFSKVLDAISLLEQVKQVDVVLDCTDNLTSRFAINQACVVAKTPLVSAAAIRLEGQLAVFNSNVTDSPCYRCLYSNEGELTETCTQTGILAPVVGMLGSLQALEAIKIITKVGTTLIGKLLLIDGLSMEITQIKLPKKLNCPVCHTN